MRSRFAGWRRVVFMVFCFCAMFTAVPATFAQSTAVNNVNAAATAAGVATTSDLPTIIGRIIYVFLSIIGIVLLVLLIVAGYLWMTAAGDAKKVDKAKAYIRNAIIGLIIVTSSFAITSFILSQLAGVSQGGGGITGAGPGAGGLGFPGSAGSLGGGIIEAHVPMRDATGVPRNTGIIITFKEPIAIASFISGYNDNNTPADLSDDVATSTTVGLNSDVVRIAPSARPTEFLHTDQVTVRFTADRRTFVLRPIQPIGTPTANTDYAVELRPALLREDGRPAFTGSFSAGYRWQFTVSTFLDTTPPRLASVIPIEGGGPYAPNIIVQMNFDEAVDPTSASGRFSDNAGGFSNMEIRAVQNGTSGPVVRPDGEFRISNGYRTVEFVTDSACGTNSCGRTVYCLPVSSRINALVKAASLSVAPPQAEFGAGGYDGIVDIAGNSFDGNKDGTAQGPGQDNASWIFTTSDRPNLNPPLIRGGSLIPQPNTGNVPVEQPAQAQFDTALQASTVNSSNVYITRENEPAGTDDTFWWSPNSEVVVGSGNEPDGRISINHRLYARVPQGGDPRTVPMYYPFILSGVQSVYQNCFNPAGSSGSGSERCDANSTNPNCCNNRAQSGACPFPSRTP